MKFEMEAEKSHQDFTLAALQELRNIFNKKDCISQTQAIFQMLLIYYTFNL